MFRQGWRSDIKISCTSIIIIWAIFQHTQWQLAAVSLESIVQQLWEKERFENVFLGEITKYTQWPQNDPESYKVKYTPYMFQQYPWIRHLIMFYSTKSESSALNEYKMTLNTTRSWGRHICCIKFLLCDHQFWRGNFLGVERAAFPWPTLGIRSCWTFCSDLVW